MSLTESEKVRLSRGLFQLLRLRLLDKPEAVISPSGQYYGGIPPYERCTLGSIGPVPDATDTVQPVPNSLGLAFLVSAPPDGPLVLEVSGQFDVAHAYIPHYDEQRAQLVPASGDQHPQELAPAYIRHTVVVASARVEVPLQGLTGVVMATPVHDTLREALARHLATVAQDPRVFRRLAVEPYTQQRRGSFTWSSAIIDQASLTAAVHEELFAAGSSPLPYDVKLHCQVSPVEESLRLTSASAADPARREYRVEVVLTNHTTRDLAQRYSLANPQVMDVQLRVKIVSGEHRRMRARASLKGSDGYGIHCALVCASDGALRTECLPSYEQPWVEEPKPADVGMREPLRLERLMRDPLPVLDELLQAMQAHIRQWQRTLAALEERGSPDAEQASRLAEFIEQARGAARGVQLLRQEAKLLRAFKLANEAMAQAFSVQGKPFEAWYLFQLVFLLVQIPHFAQRARLVKGKRRAPGSDEPHNEEEIADVLLSDTSSGKTEAYQLVLAFQMFLARITGRQYGVIAWLRFAQRALSAQQCQRLAYLVAAAERLRVREQLGGFPYGIGVFVGRATPNRISSRDEHSIDDYLLKLIDQAKKDPRILERLRFLEHCPHCNGAVKIELVADNFRIKHVCCDPNCWSNQPVPAEEAQRRHVGELGLYVTDEEVYRLLPDILLGTVDKSVVLGHAARFRTVFRATHYCRHHGFLMQRTCRHPTVDKIGDDWGDPVECYKNPQISESPSRLPRQPDPGIPIMVIDEVHQEAEELGSLDSHYISVLDEIQRSYPQGRPPKFILASATTNGVAHHIHHLCLRRARCFRARSAQHNFYSRVRRDPDSGEPLFRRRYVGVLPVGIPRGGIPEWTYEANQLNHELLSDCEAALAHEPHKICPALGLDEQRAPEALEHLRTMLSTSVLFVRRMRDAGRLESAFQADNRRRHASGRPSLRFARIDRFTSLALVRRTFAQIQAHDAAHHRYSLIATSVIASGLHVPELNVMFLVGRPLTNAEYIQTSARCARENPGTALVVLDRHQLFESSAYDHFLDFHRDLEHHVESVPIDRYAPRVLKRVLSGVLKAIVLNRGLRQFQRRRINMTDRLRAALREPKIAELFLRQIIRAYGFERAAGLGTFNSLQLKQAQEYVLAEARRHIIRLQQPPLRATPESVIVTPDRAREEGPISFMRDVELQVRVQPATDADLKVLQALRGTPSERVSPPGGAADMAFEVPYGRLFFEDYLPGGVVVLPGPLYAKVLGTDSDLQLAQWVSPELLDSVVGIVSQRFEASGGQIDERLRKARADGHLVGRVPRTLYISPFPLRLVCSNPKCLLIDEPQPPYLSHAAQVQALASRIRGQPPYIGCRECRAPLRQVPYVSVHVCGYIAPLELPIAARGRRASLLDSGNLRDLRLKDFETGRNLGVLAPAACPKCQKAQEPGPDPYAGHPAHRRSKRRISRDPPRDGVAMLPTTVRGGRAQTFFPRVTKCIGLTSETSRSLKRFRAVSSHEEVGRAVACGMLDLQNAQQLRSNLNSGSGERLAPIQMASLQQEYEKLKANVDRLRKLSDIPLALAVLDERLSAFEQQILSNQGRFTDSESYISNASLLAEVGSQQRTLEAAFIRQEFRERSWATQMAEASSERALLLQSERETLLRNYGVREVRYLENLVMVTAAVGFTRQAAEPSVGSGLPLRFNAFRDAVTDSTQETPIYVQPACTEGILIRWDPLHVLRWGIDNLGWAPPAAVLEDSGQAHSFIWRAAPLLAASPLDILERARSGSDSSESHAAVHVLGVLHTLVHALVRAASRISGYNSLSLVEYLLPADFAAVIHVTPRKTRITGGLQTLFEHGLLSCFEDAAVESRGCSPNPTCSHRHGSCHACAQLPLACETHNNGISRAYVHGGVVPEVLGPPFRVRRGFWA